MGDEPRVPAPTFPLTTRPMTDLNLLLVDADERARRALADLLGEVGYALSEAHDGVEAFRMVRERPPALVIADLFFCASVQMVERLRGVPETAGVPVLALTTLVSSEHRGRALAAGCAGYLQKPCPAEEVLAEVARIVGAEAGRACPTGAL
jgi:DNA-binding response OmpR family regulator